MNSTSINEPVTSTQNPVIIITRIEALRFQQKGPANIIMDSATMMDHDAAYVTGCSFDVASFAPEMMGYQASLPSLVGQS
jgi:hypothetical protein